MGSRRARRRTIPPVESGTMNSPARSVTEFDRSTAAIGDIPHDRVGERTKPELLAPAGDRTCLIAAVENGADAVYFGLQRHNARIRAHNFDGADLPEVMALLHRPWRQGLHDAEHAGLPRRAGRPRGHGPRAGRCRRRCGHRPGPGTGPVDPRDHARSRNPRVDPDVDHERRRESRWPASSAARA